MVPSVQPELTATTIQSNYLSDEVRSKAFGGRRPRHAEKHAWAFRPQGRRMKPQRSYSRKILMLVTGFLAAKPSPG